MSLATLCDPPVCAWESPWVRPGNAWGTPAVRVPLHSDFQPEGAARGAS